MTRDLDHPQAVVVVGDSKAGTKRARRATGFKSAQKSGQKSGQNAGPFPHEAHAAILERGDAIPVHDANRIHRAFPLRWQAYIHANFRDLNHVQQVFAVSERTARKWWSGETGVNGGHVAVAMAEHPYAAQSMLFAAE